MHYNLINTATNGIPNRIRFAPHEKTADTEAERNGKRFKEALRLRDAWYSNHYRKAELAIVAQQEYPGESRDTVLFARNSRAKPREFSQHDSQSV